MSFIRKFGEVKFLLIMYELIDSTEFGLSSRVKIVKFEDNSYGIQKKRKSRIIMKDGQQIEDIAEAIHRVKPNADIKLIISGPICSKTIKFLSNNSIEVINEE